MMLLSYNLFLPFVETFLQGLSVVSPSFITADDRNSPSATASPSTERLEKVPARSTRCASDQTRVKKAVLLNSLEKLRDNLEAVSTPFRSLSRSQKFKRRLEGWKGGGGWAAGSLLLAVACVGGAEGRARQRM